MKKTEEGGRKTGFISGYRPNHVFEYSDGQFLQTFIGTLNSRRQDTIEPGEQKLVTVRFLLNQPIEKYINVGRKWWVHEGQTVIGEAEIVEI
jgi:translation elongation factor EF-Tu-like GTPase